MVLVTYIWYWLFEIRLLYTGALLIYGSCYLGYVLLYCIVIVSFSYVPIVMAETSYMRYATMRSF